MKEKKQTVKAVFLIQLFIIIMFFVRGVECHSDRQADLMGFAFGLLAVVMPLIFLKPKIEF